MEIRSKKKEKERVVQEIHDKFDRAEAVILTDFKGLNVQQITDLRNRLRSSGAEFKVVKNTLARRAAAGTDVHQIEDHFTGATGVVLSYEEVVSPVKILYEYIIKTDLPKIKAGIVEGIVLDTDRIKSVASLPSLDVLLGKALGSIKSPLHGLATTLSGVTRGLVYALNAVKEEKAASQS